MILEFDNLGWGFLGGFKQSVDGVVVIGRFKRQSNDAVFFFVYKVTEGGPIDWLVGVSDR